MMELSRGEEGEKGEEEEVSGLLFEMRASKRPERAKFGM
jgi:hypothetical protein